jgi:hypothetical protein
LWGSASRRRLWSGGTRSSPLRAAPPRRTAFTGIHGGVRGCAGAGGLRRGAAPCRENIASPLDGGAQKLILESRVKGTDLLSRVLPRSGAPKVFVAARAAISTDNRGGPTWDEIRRGGIELSAEVCSRWRGRLLRTRGGIRVVSRGWAVLSPGASDENAPGGLQRTRGTIAADARP